jgi:hypothetical protein
MDERDMERKGGTEWKKKGVGIERKMWVFFNCWK